MRNKINIICGLFFVISFIPISMSGQFYYKGTTFKEYVETWKNIEEYVKTNETEIDKKLSLSKSIARFFPLYNEFVGNTYLKKNELDSAYFHYEKAIIEGAADINGLDSNKLKPIWSKLIANMPFLKTQQSLRFSADSNLIKKCQQMRIENQRYQSPFKKGDKYVAHPKQRGIDSLNFIELRKIIKEQGFPKTTQVGNYGVVLGLAAVLNGFNEQESTEMFDLLYKEIPNATDLWYPYDEFVALGTWLHSIESYHVFKYLKYDNEGKILIDDDISILQLYGITKILRDNKKKVRVELVAFNHPKTINHYEESLQKIYSFMCNTFDVKDNITINYSPQRELIDNNKQYSFGFKLIWF